VDEPNHFPGRVKHGSAHKLDRVLNNC